MTWYDVIFPFRRRITSQLNHTKSLQFIPPQHHWCDTSSWMTTIFLRWITNILFDFILIKHYIRRRHNNKSHLIYLITVIFFFQWRTIVSIPNDKLRAIGLPSVVHSTTQLENKQQALVRSCQYIRRGLETIIVLVYTALASWNKYS